MNKYAWIGSLVTLGALDYFCHKTHRITLSQTARELYRTDTVGGKVAWAATWAGLSLWLTPHMWKNEVKKAVEEAVDNEVANVLEFIATT